MDEIGEAIRSAFTGLYARERLDRITVKGLCAAVPVARTTFYARYRNVDDVLLEVEDGLLAGLAEVTERVSGGDLPHMVINIPGHADGLFAVKVAADDGRFVLLFSDGGYARKSWEEQITSCIAADKEAQKASLAWIREQSLDPLCVESLANHDPDVEPHVIEL